MRIETDLKLGFKDVLIRPKRSTLKSRAQVKTGKKPSPSCTVDAAGPGSRSLLPNMDTVGTFELADVLAQFGLLTAVHKHYSVQQWNEFLKDKEKTIFNHIMASTGTAESDFKLLEQIIAAHPLIEFICIDVANGYAEAFVDFVKQCRDSFPDKTIVAGNVVTGEMVEELLLSGADIVKVGIGPGSVCTTRVKNRRRLSPTVCGYRMCRRRPRTGADESFPDGGLHLCRRCFQSLRRRR